MPNLYAMLVIAVISSSSTWWVQSQHYGKIIAENENKAWNLHVEALNNKISVDRLASQKEQALLELQEVKKQKQKVITRTIEKQVTDYVKDINSGKCIIDSEWVRYHNAAAIGSLDMP